MRVHMYQVCPSEDKLRSTKPSLTYISPRCGPRDVEIYLNYLELLECILSSYIYGTLYMLV